MHVMKRFEHVPGLADRLQPLKDEASRQLLEAALSQWADIKRQEPADWRIRAFEISDSSPSDVRRVLESTGLVNAGRVTVVWPFDGFAATSDGVDVVRFYDDLWYPSRDDVLIVLPSHDMFVEFNHEEVLIVGCHQDRYG